jgi:hypothetical protein
MCVDYVLTSPRIAQADPGQRTPPRGGSVTVLELLNITHGKLFLPGGAYS